MIVAITGATGFIGSKLCEHHLKAGDDIRYLTRTNKNPIKGATAYIADLNASEGELLPFLTNVDILYHCAAELVDERKMHLVNVNGTKNLLHHAVGNVKKWVQLSSTGVYGDTTDDVVIEDSLPNPDNAYEKSKLLADNLVLQAAKLHNLNVVIVRPSNVYGSNMSNQSLFSLISFINRGVFFFIGKKGAIANYIHVDNVVLAMTLLAKTQFKKNANIYIVSDYCTIEKFVGLITLALNAKPVTLRLPECLIRILVKLAELFKFKLLTSARVDALTRRRVYSSEKLMRETAYRHKVSMEEGVTELVHFWKARKQA